MPIKKSKQMMLAMIDSELEKVAAKITNESASMYASPTEEQVVLHADNVAELNGYRAALLKLREQIVEDDYNV